MSLASESLTTRQPDHHINSSPKEEALFPEKIHKPYQLGEVKGVAERSSADFDLPERLKPAGIYDVEVQDPYLDLIDPETVEAIRDCEQEYDQLARNRRLDKKWTREPGVAYIDGDGNTRDKNRLHWGDPVAHGRFFDEDVQSPALKAWLRLIPTANALTVLADPVNIDEIKSSNGKKRTPMDDMARLWLSAGLDPIAIRTRGTVLAEIVNEYAATHKKQEDMRWMSVACGTALPSMLAAQRAGLEPELILADHDESVMAATAELAKTINFKGDISQHRNNIFDSSDFATLREYLGDNGGRPRIVDLMGIFEYTGETTGIDPAKFLRSNYDMVHPGGRIIFGQMRKDRPIPDFTMGVVGWPFIEMRSIKEIMEIVEEAGIAPSQVNLYRPTDGVYVVGSIDKPDELESFGTQEAKVA